MFRNEKIEKLIYELLIEIGENPERDGLKETPKRFAGMCKEFFGGLKQNPNFFLKTFDEITKINELILVKNVPVNSICEHHLLPFIGIAHIACIPNNNKILGFSKFARIVDSFARRLQVQERLTSEISEFLYENLNLKGIFVLIKARHFCMSMRGIKTESTEIITISTNGLFEKNKEKQLEVITALNNV